MCQPIERYILKIKKIGKVYKISMQVVPYLLHNGLKKKKKKKKKKKWPKFEAVEKKKISTHHNPFFLP